MVTNPRELRCVLESGDMPSHLRSGGHDDAVEREHRVYNDTVQRLADAFDDDAFVERDVEWSSRVNREWPLGLHILSAGEGRMTEHDCSGGPGDDPFAPAFPQIPPLAAVYAIDRLAVQEGNNKLRRSSAKRVSGRDSRSR
jgi:hypothetical protein